MFADIANYGISTTGRTQNTTTGEYFRTTCFSAAPSTLPKEGDNTFTNSNTAVRRANLPFPYTSQKQGERLILATHKHHIPWWLPKESCRDGLPCPPRTPTLPHRTREAPSGNPQAEPAASSSIVARGTSPGISAHSIKRRGRPHIYIYIFIKLRTRE